MTSSDVRSVLERLAECEPTGNPSADQAGIQEMARAALDALGGPDAVPLDDLGGPAEAMAAGGIVNRGSLDWAMQHRGFPRPVKVLQRVRIWDLRAVRAWKAAKDA